MRKCSIIPYVSMMGEAVPHVAQLVPLSPVLLDRVKGFFLGYFHLCIRPAWHFHDHVENPIVYVGDVRDIMKWRDDVSIFFDVYPVL